MAHDSEHWDDSKGHQSICNTLLMLVNSVTTFPNNSKNDIWKRGVLWNIIELWFFITLAGSRAQPLGSATSVLHKFHLYLLEGGPRVVNPGNWRAIKRPMSCHVKHGKTNNFPKASHYQLSYPTIYIVHSESPIPHFPISEIPISYPIDIFVQPDMSWSYPYSVDFLV